MLGDQCGISCLATPSLATCPSHPVTPRPPPQISFGSVLSPVGVGLMVYGFGAFFNLLPGGDVSPLLLVYGFPLMLLGFALSYAQLEPVPCYSTPEALALRESQATDIQKQVCGGRGLWVGWG